jgi:hypothetical protein
MASTFWKDLVKLAVNRPVAQKKAQKVDRDDCKANLYNPSCQNIS